MFGKLVQALGLGDPLVKAARGADSRAFAEVFRRSPVRFLCLPPAFANGMEAKGATQEQVLAYIEKAAADLAARDTFEPFGYVVDGRKILPLFTQERHAREFAAHYAQHVHRIMPFQVLTADGATLLGALSQFDAVVLNDKTSESCTVPDTHMSALRE